MAGETVGEHQGARALPRAVAARTMVIRRGLATCTARGCTAATTMDPMDGLLRRSSAHARRADRSGE
jgi:hypothetical protein